MQKKLNTILLIDDDEPTNYLNKMILEEMACADHIEIVRSGKQALEYLEKIAAGKEGAPSSPDLIFLDINMPAMDGWEFLEIFRAIMNKQKKPITLVMLTTSQNPEDEQKAKEDDKVAAFRNKPLSREMVQDILMRFYATPV